MVLSLRLMPSIGEWLNKRRSIPIMEHYSAIGRKTIETHNLDESQSNCAQRTDCGCQKPGWEERMGGKLIKVTDIQLKGK